MLVICIKCVSFNKDKIWTETTTKNMWSYVIPMKASIIYKKHSLYLRFDNSKKQEFTTWTK